MTYFMNRMYGTIVNNTQSHIKHYIIMGHIVKES